MIREDLADLPEGKEAPQLEGAPGRNSSFEITIDGVTVSAHII